MPETHIFRDPPEDADSSWGFLVGGMSTWSSDVEVARSYAEAAAALINQARVADDLTDLAYPVLFLYRHALELYLKAAVHPQPGKQTHRLPDLIQALDDLLKAQVGVGLPGDTKRELLAFAALDPDSQAFRYHASKPAPGLQAFMQQFFAVLERVIRERDATK